jgi:hypothetical protein
MDFIKFQGRIKCRKYGQEDPDRKLQDKITDIFHDAFFGLTIKAK